MLRRTFLHSLLALAGLAPRAPVGWAVRHPGGYRLDTGGEALRVEQRDSSLFRSIAQLAVEHRKMKRDMIAETLEHRLRSGKMDAVIAPQAVAPGQIGGAANQRLGHVQYLPCARIRPGIRAGSPGLDPGLGKICGRWLAGNPGVRRRAPALHSNLFRMRQFYRTCCRTDEWLFGKVTLGAAKVGTVSRLSASRRDLRRIVGTPSRQLHRADHAFAMSVEELTSPGLADVVFGLSWSHHCAIIASVTRPEQHYFYMAMAVRERWSVRELRRQLDADLFTRYVSVKRDPEKCLPVAAEQGDLLPFKDHYLLDFLGLEDSHTERQLRQAMLANLRDLFLELGRDFTFIGEEYPVVAGDDTFRVDLLFFHRRLQCLVATELKTGKFKPEYVGKCQFYLAALDEQVRLPHEKPSVGLILCKSANSVQMCLALTAATRKIGIATYQTVLPEERLILERLRRLPGMRAESFSSVPPKRTRDARPTR